MEELDGWLEIVREPLQTIEHEESKKQQSLNSSPLLLPLDELDEWVDIVREVSQVAEKPQPLNSSVLSPRTPEYTDNVQEGLREALGSVAGTEYFQGIEKREGNILEARMKTVNASENKRNNDGNSYKSSIPVFPDKYKTELCVNWEYRGSCRYGAKCQFAHGEEELRMGTRHSKVKTPPNLMDLYVLTTYSSFFQYKTERCRVRVFS